MNTMRLAVGILFVVLAAKPCTPTMARDVAQHSEATDVQADPPEHRVFQYFSPDENAHRVRPDDRFKLASSVAIPVSAPPAPAPSQRQSTAPSITKSLDDCFDGCCCFFCADPCPCVYGQVDALFLQRVPRFSDQPIVVDPNTGTTFMSTSDLNFNFDPGLQATVGMRLRGGRALEFSYFGLFEGNASAVAVSPDPAALLIFPNNLVGNVFVDMDRTQLNYSSLLHSFAVNLLCCCGCCDEGCCECGCGDVNCRSITWFAGFRYLDLGEELNITAQRIVAGAVEEGTYNIRTDNHLYGGQLGARLRRTQGRFGWEATGTAGIFANDAQQTQTVTDFPVFPIRPTVTSSGGGVAFVGGINLTGLYGLNEVWNLRAGYTGLWIEGLALAPDQLDFNFAVAPSGNILHNGGGMFLHGVNLGVEARW